jgi:hypothetical protein
MRERKWLGRDYPAATEKSGAQREKIIATVNETPTIGTPSNPGDMNSSSSPAPKSRGCDKGFRLVMSQSLLYLIPNERRPAEVSRHLQRTRSKRELRSPISREKEWQRDPRSHLFCRPSQGALNFQIRLRETDLLTVDNYLIASWKLGSCASLATEKIQLNLIVLRHRQQHPGPELNQANLYSPV